MEQRGQMKEDLPKKMEPEGWGDSKGDGVKKHIEQRYSNFQANKGEIEKVVNEKKK